MSVEDRLRRGLEANALAVVPEAEARLDAVHRRLRRRRSRLAAAAAAVVFGLGAATAVVVSGGQGSAPMPSEPLPSPTPLDPAPEPVPTGVWERVITPADGRAVGIPDTRLEELLGPDRRLPERLSLTGDTFSQDLQDRSGVFEVGDYGAVRAERSRLVMVSDSPGCPECEYTFRWRLDGDLLVLEDMQGESVTPVDRLMFEGVYTRGEP